MNDCIILKCVKEKRKLRIKFHLYVDQNGKKYEDVYNNNLNCRFPKDIRKDGSYYKISSNDLSISYIKDVPFYNVKFQNIQHASPLDALKDIYRVDECICCLTETPNITLIPCGHVCTCISCYEELRHKFSGCPLCRKKISQAYIN